MVNKKVFLGWILWATWGLALAAGTGVQASTGLPPEPLPEGTTLLLEDAQGHPLWQSGQGTVPGADLLKEAAYVVLKLPDGTAYTYPVVHSADALGGLLLQVDGKKLALASLLKSLNAELEKGGRLAVHRPEAPSAHGQENGNHGQEGGAGGGHANPSHGKP